MSEQWVASQAANIKTYFYLGQIVLGALLVAGLFWGRRRNPETGFRLREAERLKNATFARFPAPIEPETPLRKAAREARNRRKDPPLQLEGISLDGAPHQILGVAANASAPEIQRAWRELMKRYHPDLVGRPGSREWVDAQRIAEAINNAKEAMVERRKRS
jgi:DnaJ-domain-containing protein 1